MCSVQEELSVLQKKGVREGQNHFIEYCTLVHLTAAAQGVIKIRLVHRYVQSGFNPSCIKPSESVALSPKSGPHLYYPFSRGQINVSKTAEYTKVSLEINLSVCI